MRQLQINALQIYSKHNKITMSSRHEKGYMPWDRTGNKLLVKSELGSNKPTLYKIPDSEFVYGKLTPDDPEHLSEVVYKWKDHQSTDNQNHLRQKDLIATNKQCLKSLLHTSQQFSGFRKGNTQYKGVIEGTNLVSIKLPEATHSYGLPLDMEDPMKLVITNSYGEDDRYLRHTFYNNQSQQSSAPSRKLSCHITKNHNLVKEANVRRIAKFSWGRPEDLWKLSKFRDTNSKVETRRVRAQSIK